jgi:transposase
VFGVAAQKWLKEEAIGKLDEQEQIFMNQFLEQFKLLRQQQRDLLARAAERVDGYGEEAEIAQSIPGFGKLVTLAILSAVAGVARFETPDQLAAYLGVCGTVEQSGDYLRLGSITRRGNKHARWLLGQAVTNLIKKDPKARKRYMKLRRKKAAKVVRVALMRWIVTVLWRMLTNKEKYRLNGLRGSYLMRKAMKRNVA